MKRIASLLPVVAALALPGQALAVSHDSYVDQGTGHDSSNFCADPMNPCKTITRGITYAGAGRTIFVNGGHTYSASLTLGDGKSLVHKDFAGAGGPAILDDGTNTASFDINVTSAAGKIDGFTIRGDGGAINAAAPVKVSHDVFDDPTLVHTEVRLANPSGRAVATHDTFIDPTPTTGTGDYQTAIQTEAGKATVEHSTFTGFNLSIGTGSGHTEILDNDISGAHGRDFNVTGVGIYATNATVTGNYVHDFASTVVADGIDAGDGAVLRRNRVIGATAEASTSRLRQQRSPWTTTSSSPTPPRSTWAGAASA